MIEYAKVKEQEVFSVSVASIADGIELNRQVRFEVKLNKNVYGNGEEDLCTLELMIFVRDKMVANVEFPELYDLQCLLEMIKEDIQIPLAELNASDKEQLIESVLVYVLNQKYQIHIFVVSSLLNLQNDLLHLIDQSKANNFQLLFL